MGVRVQLHGRTFDVRVIVDDLVLLQIDIQAKTRYVPPHSVMVNFDTAVLLRVLQLCAPTLFRVEFSIETAANKAMDIFKRMCAAEVSSKFKLKTLAEAAGTEIVADDSDDDAPAAAAKKHKRSSNIDDHIADAPVVRPESPLASLFATLTKLPAERVTYIKFALELSGADLEAKLLPCQEDMLSVMRAAMALDADKLLRFVTHVQKQ